FVAWRGADLARHSFPTRRSSDLVEIDPREERSDHFRDLGGRVFSDPLLPAVDRSRESLHDVGVLIEVTLPRVVDGVGDVAALGTDRKSTRLNSSHVKISYAVFCL